MTVQEAVLELKKMVSLESLTPSSATVSLASVDMPPWMFEAMEETESSA